MALAERAGLPKLGTDESSSPRDGGRSVASGEHTHRSPGEFPTRNRVARTGVWGVGSLEPVTAEAEDLL
jgi:hypothetical protein